MLKSLPVGVILSDSEGLVIYFSPLAQKILAPCQITLKRGDSLIPLIHPHQQSRFREDLLLSVQAYNSPTLSEFKFCQNSAEIWTEITFTPVVGFDERKDPLIMLVMRNITEKRMEEVVRQQNLERQELLNHVLQLLYRPQNLRNALEQVIGLMGVYTRASHVYLAENSSDGLKAEITLEWYADKMKPRTADVREFSYDQISFIKTMEARGLVCVSEQQPLSSDAADLLEACKIRSFVAIPVYGKNDLHGFIAYDDVEFSRTWNAEEQDLLRNISRTISNAFARQELNDEERSQRLLAEVLREISSVVNSTLSFEDMLDYLLSNLERVIPHQGANFALLDDDNQIIITKARGYPPEIMKRVLNTRIPLSSWKTFQQVSQSDEPVLIPDTNLDSHWVTIPGIF